MTSSKKSAPSASSPTVLSSEASKRVNQPNAVPYKSKARAERYLYGGLLFPSRIVAAKEMQSIEREVK